MFARSVSIRLKSNTPSDFLQILDAEVLPLLRKQKGFKEAIALSNPDSRDVIAISLWENRDWAEAYNNDAYTRVMNILARVIDGPPKVQTFEQVTSAISKSL
jgi:hypothetical protein